MLKRTHTQMPLSRLMSCAPLLLSLLKSHGLKASVPFEKKKKILKVKRKRQSHYEGVRGMLCSVSLSVSLDVRKAYMCLYLCSAHLAPLQTAILWRTAIPTAWLLIYSSGNRFIPSSISSSCLPLFPLNLSH